MQHPHQQIPSEPPAILLDNSCESLILVDKEALVRYLSTPGAEFFGLNSREKAGQSSFRNVSPLRDHRNGGCAGYFVHLPILHSYSQLKNKRARKRSRSSVLHAENTSKQRKEVMPVCRI